MSVQNTLNHTGDDSKRDPPVPIPNTEVKPLSAECTWLETARENRTSPVFYLCTQGGGSRGGRTDNFRLGVVEALDNTASIAFGLRLAQPKILAPCHRVPHRPACNFFQYTDLPKVRFCRAPLHFFISSQVLLTLKCSLVSSHSRKLRCVACKFFQYIKYNHRIDASHIKI